MKYVVVALALLSSTAVHAKAGQIFNRECEQKNCSYSQIVYQMKLSSNKHRILLNWHDHAPTKETRKADLKIWTYDVDCAKKTVHDASEEEEQPYPVFDDKAAWPKTSNPQDMKAAWLAVCKK